ncbi:glutathione S-transferase [Methylobacillus sp.]|uniref:glutathione S-transferase n=1 Tax=Methylobacillus sp. TaxID=56818 RepID=UPI002FE201FC
MVLPILYSYRRCPYAMRARMALHYAGVKVETREISFRAKPAHMLQISPKGTVPVLQLADGEVLEQSLDIMHWALAQHDPENWLGSVRQQADAVELITLNDGEFKQALDRYKYADRFPDQPSAIYRAQGERFLTLLEGRLAIQSCLQGEQPHLADVAIFPFIRQFSMVDVDWFVQADYPRLRGWLNAWLASELFQAIMQKCPVYTDE